MATYKISGLTAITSVSGTNLLEVSEVSASGYRSRKATTAQVRTYMLEAISGYSLAKTSLANVSATTTLDMATANFFSTQVSGSTSFVFANVPTSTVASGLILEITNGGGYTITWPSSVKWPSGTAPTI